MCKGSLEESENLLHPDVFAEKIIDDFGVLGLAFTARLSKFVIDLRGGHMFALFTEDFLRLSADKELCNQCGGAGVRRLVIVTGKSEKPRLDFHGDLGRIKNPRCQACAGRESRRGCF